MQALKTILVMSLGLGATWGAWQIAPAKSSGMLTSVAYAQEAAETDDINEAEGTSDEEIEEQLQRIEAALAEEGEVKEFKPSEPLPADMAIEMSSEL